MLPVGVFEHHPYTGRAADPRGVLQAAGAEDALPAGARDGARARRRGGPSSRTSRRWTGSRTTSSSDSARADGWEPAYDGLLLDRIADTLRSAPCRASRRLSHHISEGDGIAIIVHVGDARAARAAEEAGREGARVDIAIDGIREATTLPLLWRGRGTPGDADALTIRAGDEDGHGETELEVVVDVRDEDELERALERLDPEIFLLSAREVDEGDDPVESVLALLPDVPAGKLAIAEVDVASRDEVLQLERAGFDAVLVPSGDVGRLVGTRPPDV